MNGLILFVLVCTFLPFLPGNYDGLAVTLSILAQLFGLIGLTLVPIGGLWLVYELRMRGRAPRARSGANPAYYFAVTALVVAALIAALLALSAATALGLSLGVILLAASAYFGWRAAVRAKRLKYADRTLRNPAPWYLIVVPVVIASVQLLFVGSAVQFSRERAIQNSAALLHDIEEYHKANGRYPVSLLSLVQDYDPGVIGIERYHYEPNGDAYDIFFEQLSNVFGTREIVMFNKRGEHSLPSHDSDLLLWTPEQLRARPGHYALHDAGPPHWKYFWFD
jgi:hypothetical protein